MPKIQVVIRKGFSLLEILIVIIVLGMLSVFAVSIFGNEAGSTRALDMEVAGGRMVKLWTALTDACSVGRKVVGTVLAAPGYRAQDVLAAGQPAMAPAWQSCYLKSALRPVNDMIRTNNNRALSIADYAFDFAGGPPYTVTFYHVTWDVTATLAERYSTMKINGAIPQSNTTDGHVQYQPDGSGSWTVQLIFM